MIISSLSLSFNRQILKKKTVEIKDLMKHLTASLLYFEERKMCEQIENRKKLPSKLKSRLPRLQLSSTEWFYRHFMSFIPQTFSFRHGI